MLYEWSFNRFCSFIWLGLGCDGVGPVWSFGMGAFPFCETCCRGVPLEAGTLLCCAEWWAGLHGAVCGCWTGSKCACRAPPQLD